MLLPNSNQVDVNTENRLTYDSLSSIREETDIESQTEESCKDYINRVARQNQDIVCCFGSFVCSMVFISIPTFVLLYYFA